MALCVVDPVDRELWDLVRGVDEVTGAKGVDKVVSSLTGEQGHVHLLTLDPVELEADCLLHGP